MDASEKPLLKIARDRLLTVEVASRNKALRTQLDEVLSSRSWAATKPLRALSDWLRRHQGSEPWRPSPLQPAESGELVEIRHQNVTFPGMSQPRRWLIDVTDLAHHEFRGGVQRVSRALLVEWLIEAPTDALIEPVRLAAGGGYCHARRFLAKTLGVSASQFGADIPLAPQATDVFIGLDLVRDYADHYRDALVDLRLAGVDITVLTHDVLPLMHPDWFPAGTASAFEAWFKVVAEHANRMLCISEQTRNDIGEALRARALSVPIDGLHCFPLGADLPQWPAETSSVTDTRAGFRILSVGTLETRKGYADVLQAVEQLWQAGIEVDWTIVGGPGWGVDGLIDRLRRHPESGQRLHWLEDVDDAQLSMLYQSCDLLVQASYGEGYGLPIAEAAAAGLSLLVRDIPVFWEVTASVAEYFGGPDGPTLEQALLALRVDKARKRPSRVRETWFDSARAFSGIVSTSIANRTRNESE